jgi:hypothetical protein
VLTLENVLWVAFSIPPGLLSVITREISCICTIFIYVKDRMIKVVFLVAYIKIYQDLYFFYINHWCESDTGEHILFLVLSDQ